MASVGAGADPSAPVPCLSPPWEVVPLADFALPRALDPAAVRKRWVALRRVLGLRRRTAPAPVRQEADLQALAPARLHRLVPPLDWTAPARALDLALGDWPASGPPVQFLVAPPQAGAAAILRRWATCHGALCLADPSPREVLQGAPGWLAAWQAAVLANGAAPGRAWVLPALERCYLRHAAGLGLVRQLLWLALSGQLGPGLIGCDSWAWAYLQYVWDLPEAGVLTLQAFDGRRLGSALRTDARPTPDQPPPRFCNARTGAEVLPDPARLADDAFEVGSELKQLAARCRGNLGIARAQWRARLRAEPEGERAAEAQTGAKIEGDKSAGGPTGEPGDAGAVVWVGAEIEAPADPGLSDEAHALVLHSLLLHNGLSAELLPDLLPLRAAAVQGILLRLAAPPSGLQSAAGWVRCDQGRWQVDPLHYPTVRECLAAQGLLCDRF